MTFLRGCALPLLFLKFQVPMKINFLLSFPLLALLLAGVPHLRSVAQPIPPVATMSPLLFSESFDPPGDDAPPDSRGAGSRNDSRCSASDAPAQPMLPAQAYGLTFASHPTIWVNLPKTSARQLVLTFQDEAHTTHQQAVFPAPSQSGIHSFQLPDGSGLTVGKNYRWSLVLVCGNSVQPDDPVLSGWVQRVDRTAQIDRVLNEKTAIEQAQWYAQEGYWYELLAVLHQNKQIYPDLWQEFLQTAGVRREAH
jgi:hypothetical protein